MSDLTGGRASNGGARTGGPVPVGSSSGPAGMRTPTDVMRIRQERERRKQEEASRADEQRRIQAEERRRSAERRAQAVTGASSSAAEPRYSARASSQYSQEQADNRLSGTGRVASGAQYGEPTGRSMADLPAPLVARTRGPSVSAQEQPRAVPATSGGSRRSQASSRQAAPDPSPISASAPAMGASQAGETGDVLSAQRGNASSFPHAFERWEQLSSHWEGLTGYWLRKLEANQDEIARTVPTASSMSRQITDLSAAGANLFHAVVELQRLRASSERKFQRWFFETRSDNERSSEIRGQMEQQLNVERTARQEAARKRVESDIVAENARREVAEMRRELMISKEEARRAWEELGRRNQESLETAQSLKDGRVTVVAGVQVVPYFGGPSRTGSASQRPTTREGGQSYGVPTSASGALGLQTPGDEQAYYQDRPSPTDTDPFTESAAGGRRQSLHHEPGVQSLAAGTYQPYPMGGTPGSGSTGQTIIPTTSGAGRSSSAPRSQPPIPVTSEEAQRFYQRGSEEAFLQSPPQQPSAAAILAAQRAHSSQQAKPADVQAPYGGTMSEEDTTEYAFDADGNVRRDEQGRPIVSRRAAEQEISEPSMEEYDSQASARREQELAAAYAGRLGGGNVLPPEAPSAPATSAQAMETYTPTSSSEGQPEGSGPDYEGGGYDRWESLQATRHHHPTRLSDVLEEEEERSSRRTAD